jgi:hypothetical protein
MPVILPELGDRIEYLSACAWIGKKAKRALALYEEDQESLLQCSYQSKDGLLFAQRILGKIKGDLHLHVNIASESYFESFGHSEPKRLVDSEYFVEKLTQYIGTKLDTLMVFGEYRIERNKLPDKGVVGSLSGVSLEVAGSELTFNGAELHIDDEEYQRLNWRIAGDKIEGRLYTHYTQRALEENYLALSVARIEQGIDRFLLEKHFHGEE